MFTYAHTHTNTGAASGQLLLAFHWGVLRLWCPCIAAPPLQLGTPATDATPAAAPRGAPPPWPAGTSALAAAAAAAVSITAAAPAAAPEGAPPPPQAGTIAQGAAAAAA